MEEGARWQDAAANDIDFPVEDSQATASCHPTWAEVQATFAKQRQTRRWWEQQ